MESHVLSRTFEFNGVRLPDPDPKLSVEDVRTMLYRAGVKINVIQARLGHSRWQTTADWYIENHAEGERTAADVASKLLDGWERKEEVKEDVSVPKCCRNVAVRLDREEPSL
jgi:hypothetical protein